MAPKAAKKSSAKRSGSAAQVQKREEAGLTCAQFEEESWRACVCMVVGGRPQDLQLTRALALAVKKPLRRLFTLLTWDSTLEKTHELGTPKARKAAGGPLYSEVTEPAKELLDAGEEIPCDLVARILKFQLLQIKASDQLRRAAEQAEERTASAHLFCGKDDGKKNKNQTSTQEGREKRSRLRRRDDAEPPIFIDDEPLDGPQCYVLLLGFHQPRLVRALEAVGVHVSAVVRLSSEGRLSEEQQTSEDLTWEVAAQARDLDLFWSGLRPVLDSGPPDSKLHDVVQLSYTVPDLLPPIPTQDPEAQLELGTRVFQGVASLIYECLDWRRQHRHYLDNIRLLCVPSVVLSHHLQPAEVSEHATGCATPPHKPPPSCKRKLRPERSPRDLRRYNSLLDLVPPECCSVPLILHCMLEQVVISMEPEELEPQPEPQQGSLLIDHQLGSLMLQTLLPLVHTEELKSHMLNKLLSTVQNEEDKQKLLEAFGTETTQKKPDAPQIIRHHDKRALRLRGRTADEGFDVAEAELSMMKLSPPWRLIHSGAQQRNSASCWRVVKQQLQHYCTDDTVSWPEVQRFFHQSVFESMSLTRLDQEGVLLSTAGPLEPDPSSGRVSDIQSCRLRSLLGWHYTEHHQAAVLPQVLQSAFEDYRCLDTFRGSLNNILYIFCHNPMSPNRWCKEFWDIALHTDVKLRSYVEHVAETISEWTRGEEEKRLRSLSSVEAPTDKATDSAEDGDTQGLVYAQGSLKAWRLEQDRLKEEEAAKKSKKGPTPRGKLQQKDNGTLDPTKSPKSLPVVKKGGVEKAGASKSITAGEEENKEEAFSAFTGYSMDGRLIHVSGCLQHLFPSDGGHVTVESISYTEGSSMMKVALKKDGHYFYTHINQVVDAAKTSSEQKNTDKKEDSQVPVIRTRLRGGSLSAVLDSGIHLSYSVFGSTGEHTASFFSLTAGPHGLRPNHQALAHGPLPQAWFKGGAQECEGQPRLPSCPFNSLNLSTPHGLVLQFLREDMEGVSSGERGMLVRQSFPLHVRGTLQDPFLSKEVSRIITSQGAVIRNMRDGSTEVLFADGSVSTTKDSSPAWASESGVEPEDHCKEQSSGIQGNPPRGRWRWLTTTSSGAHICTVGATHKNISTTPVVVFKATDPITHEVMLSREDLVVSVQNPDGSRSVEHAEGTRITTLYQDRPLNMPSQPLNTGQQHESEPLKSNSGYQDQCDSEDETTRDRTKNLCDEEAADPEGESIESRVNNGVFVGENGRTRACGSVSATEQVVVVEKEGCATVVMYPERHSAHVFLADGTVITGNNSATYEVFPSSGGLLLIQRDGNCVYSTNPLVTPSPQGGSTTIRPGTYTMSHSERVACDITDPEGNHFQVLDDGQISVQNASLAPRTLHHDDEEEEEVHFKPREHCPRLFLLHEDGSGTELLSSQAVEELLYQAHSDPTVAVLQEPLPNTQDDVGITILKPSHQSVWSSWLLGKQNPDITPPNLRNRSWHDFPCKERKTCGPPFGTTMGRGLTLRGSSCGSAAPPVRSGPQVLEIRELYRHRPFTTQLRRTGDMRLKRYMESLMQREQHSEEVMVKDPRTQEESVHASDLLSLVLSFAEEGDVGGAFGKRAPVDIFSLYCQGVENPAEPPGLSEDSASTTSDRQDRSEEKACREALRKKTVVPYFHPENIPFHQASNLLRHQVPGPRRLSEDLHPLPEPSTLRADPHQASECAAGVEAPRPLNPTPSQSASHAAGRRKMAETRPAHPTPQTAGESSPQDSSRPPRPVQVDVTGKPRKTKVRLPASILSSKPCSVPNEQFLSVEEPVRRRCRIISLTDPSVVVRGFQLLPCRVDFGRVQEGTTSTVTVVMKNVGVDTCRFHVKQPPPATGLHVIYNPGPVPAGLHVQLHIRLFAMCAGQLGDREPPRRVCQDILIRTELEDLCLPVTASILSTSQ
ncbi:sperm-associated antigen 17 [Aulostomus maculatus]